MRTTDEKADAINNWFWFCYIVLIVCIIVFIPAKHETKESLTPLKSKIDSLNKEIERKTKTCDSLDFMIEEMNIAIKREIWKKIL